jgi:hypothetical protein
MTGKTLGKTTDASARYSYNILISISSVVFLTRVALNNISFINYLFQISIQINSYLESLTSIVNTSA